MSAMLEDVLVAGGILALLLIALEVGFVVGRRATTDVDARAGLIQLSDAPLKALDVRPLTSLRPLAPS